MKLTWFGGKNFRLYLGGKIVLVRHGPLLQGVDAREASAGADDQIDLAANALEVFNPDQFNNGPKRLIDQTEVPQLHLSAFASGACLVAPDEPQLFVAPSVDAEWGRFADGAVVVLTGAKLPDRATRLFAVARPKLLALAVEEIGDADFAAIAAAAGQSAVQMLERGMALEA